MLSVSIRDYRLILSMLVASIALALVDARSAALGLLAVALGVAALYAVRRVG